MVRKAKRMKIQFRFLTGDINWLDYGAKWISKRFNNGDWDYWLVLELTNMWEATGEQDQPKYNVTLSAVSPEAAKDNMQAALKCCGLEGESDLTDLMKVEVLHTYGTSAPLKQWNGGNAHKLLKEAKHEAQLAEMLFGFYMDSPKNAIGSTGWDFISGDLFPKHDTIEISSTPA